MDNETITKKITVSGIVQGVGIRPLVYRIAQKYGIKGTVKNIGGLVEINTQSTQEELNIFIEELNNNSLVGCEILDIRIEDKNNITYNFSDFRIIDSDLNDKVSIIPVDLPVCAKCQTELFDENDRRYNNPFISCISCGPRYTIIEELPYDRHTTTMKDFNMCSACAEEYISPEDRRFHAQTISCNDCGPYLIFSELCDKEALKEAVRIIRDGGIIAVKGIGGYHFVCSPFIEDAVLELRKLKGREEKPFAVMFNSLSSVEEYCVISDKEKELIQSRARPIVLLYNKEQVYKKMAESTNNGSIYCGAFLPYTPLQILLTKICGPLIMTSANISNQPIIKDDSEMLSLQSPYLKGVLYNTRRIIRSVDDSVAKIVDNKIQIIRRSRGYVPYPVFLPIYKKNLHILATGSDLKTAYCLYRDGSAVVSQYFGDLEEQTIFNEYKHSIDDVSRLLKLNPELIVCDMHPNYYSSRYAHSLGIPIIKVQHHHAHIASVMAEHNLRGRVIGIAFDGTGYGTDGNIWGSEFLVCEGADYRRLAHLDYTPIIGGDQSSHDAKKTTTCYLLSLGLREYINDERVSIIEAALNSNINTVLSSSMGRLFDVVASILNIKNTNSYEGECAILLEKEAYLAKRANKRPIKLQFSINYKKNKIGIDIRPVIETLCERLKNKDDIGCLSLGFHYAISDVILKVCEIIRDIEKTNTVALSGGVFQNTILTEETLRLLKNNGFDTYINTIVPPNDGCISLGQTFIGLMR